MTTKANPKDQNLTGKGDSLLKSAYTAIDGKFYKKALKYLDELLALYPTNAEGVAAKGLCIGFTCSMANTAVREEAVSYLKKGASYNLKSFHAWYFQGLLYKHWKQYGDAMKAFTQANKLQTDHRGVMRELAFVQAQTGSWEAYLETRRRWLQEGTINEGPRSLWGGFAVANHMCGRIDIAIQSMHMLDRMLYQASLMEGNDEDYEKHRVEDTERHLYTASLYMEKEDYAGAIDILSKQASAIRDRVASNEMLGQCYLALGEHSKQAEKCYRDLLATNPDNYLYHEGLLRALGLDFTTAEAVTKQDNTTSLAEYSALVQHYMELSKQYPKCNAMMRLPLNFIVGAEFDTQVRKYLQERLVKGIPSLFEDLTELYLDPTKATTLCNIIASFVSELTSHNRFNATDEVNSVTPSAALWALTYQAKEREYLGETDQALTIIDKAIAHTPTCIDLYLTKGTIYRAAGNEELAVFYADKARSMDTADRYINNTSARFAMEAGRTDLAERMMRLFIRQGDMHNYLYNQQCTWFHGAMGRAFAKMRVHGRASKNLLSVDDHFDGYIESLYDYHLYCTRKCVFRSYVNMCRTVQTFKEHKFYIPAMLDLIYMYRELSQRQAVEAKVFAQRVVKGSSVTIEQYLSGTVNDENVKARAAQMMQDKSIILAGARDTVEQQYQSTPMWAERTLLLESKSKKVDEDERYTFGRQQPEHDFFGWKNVEANTPYLKEAMKYAQTIATVPKPVLSSLFAFVDVAVWNNKVLLATKTLYKAASTLATFKQDLQDNKESSTRVLRKQVCGLPWFQLDTVNDRVQAILLPLLFDAQMHIAKTTLSVVDTTAVPIVTKALEHMKAEKFLYEDLHTSTEEYFNAQPDTFTAKAIAAIAVVKGFLAAQQLGVIVNLAEAVTKYFDFASYGVPSTSDRVILRIAVETIKSIDGTILAQFAPIDGVNITKEDAAIVPDLTATYNKLVQFAATHFKSDITYYTSEDLVALQKQTEITVEYLPSEEAIKEAKKEKK